MTPTFEQLQQQLKQLPGLGYRSAERIALHLLVEKPERLEALIEALQEARGKIGSCPVCGNLSEGGDACAVCADASRDKTRLCIVEQVTDLASMERSGVYRGLYHVLHGKLSPINDVGPDDLNFISLQERLRSPDLEEVILALSNDIEGEATCHYIQDAMLTGEAASNSKDQDTGTGDEGEGGGAQNEDSHRRGPLRLTRIGFGLPSGGGIVYADAVTLRNALEGRREYH